MALEFKRNKLNVKDGSGDFVEIPVLGEQKTEKATVGELAIEVSRATAAEEAIAARVDKLQKVVGSPFVAATAASMTNTDRVYVYTGSETGYTAGNWYYYDGTAWVSGGVYNSAGVNVDDTLTYEGMAADAKATGDEFTNVKNAISQKAPLIINTASGDIASFADGANGMQIRKIVGTIVPQQAGSGDPSPTNVRSISGYTQVKFFGTGKNLLNPNDANYGNYTIGPDGAYTEESDRIASGYIPMGAGVSLELSTKKGTSAAGSSLQAPFMGIAAYDENHTFISRAVVNTTPRVGFVTPSGTKYVRVFEEITNSEAQLPLTPIVFSQYEQQLEVSARETAYEAFGTTLPINWEDEAGTIYGGSFTLNEDGSADVVSTHLFVTLDGSSDEDITAGSDGAQARWYPPSAIRSIIRYPSIASTTNSFANYLKVVSQSASWIDNMFSMASNNYVYMRCDIIGALANWRTYLAEHSLQFCFELKQTAYAFYHFDNIGQLYTYLGTNNIWIDTGAITECDYPADTKLYIDGLTEPDEDMIADGLIASGKYFTVNNQLYLSTAQIAAGAQIIPGSNCTATSITEALNALNS